MSGEPPWDLVKRASLIDTKVTDLVAAGATKVREEMYSDAAAWAAPSSTSLRFRERG